MRKCSYALSKLCTLNALKCLRTPFTLLLLLFFSFAGAALAAENLLDKRISLIVEKKEIRYVLNEISKKADIRFIYSVQRIPATQKVTLVANDKKVGDILNTLLGPLDVLYYVSGSQVVLMQKGQEEEFVSKLKDLTTEQITKETLFLKEITGKVSNEKNEALSGASVTVKGTSRGTTTNADGVFSINAEPGETLEILMVGYSKTTVQIGNSNSVIVKLQPEISHLSEVMVVGYATQKKVTVTGAVTQVKGAELEKSPAINLSNSLVGRLPGITAINHTGEPGRDGSTLRIRGSNTLGNSSALIVIDGIPDRAGGLERLNPGDIETFSVLKDAAAAIYGARAANGVILITTKKGKAGKPSLTYDVDYGWAQPSHIPKMMDAVQYTTANNELVLFSKVAPAEWTAGWKALSTTGIYTTAGGTVINAAYKPDAIKQHGDGSDIWKYPNTNWFKDALKTWAGQKKHNIQISGGSENIKYLISLGYLHQDGIYKNSATGYKQYDARINLDIKVNEYINVSLGIVGREEFRFFPTASTGSIFRMLMRGKPTEPEFWPNGLPGPDIENGENPAVITTNQTGYDKIKQDYLQSNGKIEIKVPWIKGLKLTGIASLDKFFNTRKLWQTPWYLYFWDKNTYEADGKTPKLTKSIRSTFNDPRLTESIETRLNVMLGSMINYDQTFGDHAINFLAGVTKETIASGSFNAFRRYFLSPSLDQLFAGGEEERANGGGAYERARLSYFGRVQYNYQEKYLAEFLWRYDGSYIFPESDRFGFFPGLLLGWNISQEKFFRNVRGVNFLKLRASIGQMGNDQVFFNGNLQEYAYLATYGFARSVFADQVARTLFETRLANPTFTWEIANNSNIGIDAAFFNNRLSLEADFFYNKRTKILWQKAGSTPASAGINLPPANFGIVDNKGFELQLGYKGLIGKDVKYTVSVNGGYSKNKVINFDEAPNTLAWQKAEGAGFGTNGFNYLVYEYDGVFRDQEDIAKNTIDYTAVTKTLRPGDMKFKDANEDNKINADDRVRLNSNRDPKFTYGINITMQYKNFDLSVLLQGATGGLLYTNTESGDIGNYLQHAWNNRWTVDNPSSVDPRLANRGDTYYTGGAYGQNTYWFRSSNYLRIKNIELSYNISDDRLQKIGLKNLRIYLSALNLVTWDKLKIYDPEATQGDGKYYPQSRLINTGIRITL